MANIIKIEKLTIADEISFRKWILPFDPILSLHRQVKDYFFSNANIFGIYALKDGDEYKTGLLYSVYKDKTHIHRIFGDSSNLNEIVSKIGFPCDAYFIGDDKPIGESWKHLFDVTPGYKIDHKAYSGVFSRVAPRFAGSVWSHD